MGWQFLYQRGVWELWKTPTKYLVCYHYGGQYEFYPDYQTDKTTLDKKPKKQYNKSSSKNKSLRLELQSLAWLGYLVVRKL